MEEKEQTQSPAGANKEREPQKPLKYKLNAMQCYTRILRLIKQKNIFKDRQKLSSLLRKTAAEVKETF